MCFLSLQQWHQLCNNPIIYFFNGPSAIYSFQGLKNYLPISTKSLSFPGERWKMKDENKHRFQPGLEKAFVNGRDTDSQSLQPDFKMWMILWPIIFAAVTLRAHVSQGFRCKMTAPRDSTGLFFSLHRYGQLACCIRYNFFFHISIKYWPLERQELELEGVTLSNKLYVFIIHSCGGLSLSLISFCQALHMLLGISFYLVKLPGKTLHYFTRYFQ